MCKTPIPEENRSYRRRYCSDACRETAKRMRTDLERRGKLVLYGEDVPQGRCAMCLRSLEDKQRLTKVFCSDKCRRDFHYHIQAYINAT